MTILGDRSGDNGFFFVGATFSSRRGFTFLKIVGFKKKSAVSNFLFARVYDAIFFFIAAQKKIQLVKKKIKMTANGEGTLNCPFLIISTTQRSFIFYWRAMELSNLIPARVANATIAIESCFRLPLSCNVSVIPGK